MILKGCPMIRRAVWFAAALAVCGISLQAQDPAPEEEAPPAAGGLEAAADLSQEWSSYSFSIEVQIEGAGKPGKIETQAAEGVEVKAKGLFVKAGSVQAIRTATKAAIQGEDGVWKVLAQTKGGGAKGSKQERTAAAVNPPSKELVDVDRAFESVKEAKEGELAVYSGKLTSEGATQLLGSAARRYLRVDGAEASATATISLDAAGHIAAIKVEALIKSRLKDQDVEVKVVKRVTISKIAASDFEIPEEAKKILEG